VGVERTTANACTLLDFLELDVPVYSGASRALISERVEASYVHGQDGLGNSQFPPSQRQVLPEHAANALVRLGNEAPGELTLVAIGPLTNLALATRLDPDLPRKYQRLVVMGGAIHGQGNTTPTAEFNVYTDPEAAAVVFDSWPRLELVSWETTLAHGLAPEQVESLWAAQTRRGEFFRRITGHTLDFVQKILSRRTLLEPDLLAMAVAIEPDIVTLAEDRHVAVELAGTHTRGQTTVDWMGTRHKQPNAHLVLEMDRARIWELTQLTVS
jgi:purine nucleosidase